MASLLSQKEFKEICGVSKQVVYKAIRAGHIKTKMVGKTKKVIFDHETTKAWYDKKVAEKSNKLAQKEPEKPKSKGNGKAEETLSDLQKEKVIEEIGKIRADKRLKELKYQKERGDLIEKETLAKVLFHYLDALNINMMELPEMIIDTVIDKVKAGASRGDIIKIWRDRAQRDIKKTKESVNDRLK